MFRVLDSEKILKDLGYTYIRTVQPREEPERAELRFSDILPELCMDNTIEICNERLYIHQLQALESLSKEESVILRSGTGSGKTEAWLIYALKRCRYGSFRVLAVYPTLALANDQIRRIELYSSRLNIKVLKLDAKSRDEIASKHGPSALKRIITESQILVTNPAFLLHEIKKFAIDRRSLIEPFLTELDMLVLDEFDFYGPRSLALLLAIIKLVSMFSRRKPQIVVLTATLANPEDVCQYIEEVTGRRCTVIDGKAFRVENRIYLVVGKDLERIWRTLHEKLQKLDLTQLPSYVVETINNFEVFTRNVHRVIATLQGLGVDVPSIALIPEEIVEKYVDDEGVTLVFTRSIARAEELYRTLIDRLPPDKRNLVAVHHHLVPKNIRERIEQDAQEGRIKIVISPRTLTQGIDIGTVVRVVHIGLPEDVREFLQREGRKGRRKAIPFSESIVIPSSRWDWEILTKGIDAFFEWLSLPVERTIINKDNKYIHMFIALAKLLSKWLPKEFSDKEIEVLKQIGVYIDNRFDESKAKRIWEKLNFYEYGPPYGIKRYLQLENGEEQPLEPIGHCDLVERFQIGCIDLSSDAIVVALRRGRSSRIVTAVVERPLRSLSFRELDALAEAFEEYRFVKKLWGEEPNFLKDVARGKLQSHVHCVVYAPRNGFGELRKVPNRVVWMVTASRPRVARIGNNYVVYYPRRPIYIPVNTAGEYRDYTYGIVIETSDIEAEHVLRIGLAYLMVILRKMLAIPFETVMYGIERIGDRKVVELHEPEAAGIIESLNWAYIKQLVDSYKPSDIDYVLLQLVDEIAYYEMISSGIDLETAKEFVKHILDYIELKDKIKIVFEGRTIEVPKPSRALKIVVIDALTHEIDEDTPIPKTFIAIGYFDGENINIAIDIYVKIPFAKPPRSLLNFENEVEELVLYEEFKPIVVDSGYIDGIEHRAKLKRLASILREAEKLDELFRSRLGERTYSLDVVGEELIRRNIIDCKHVDVQKVFDIVNRCLGLNNIDSVKKCIEKHADILREYLSYRLRVGYMLYLVLSSL